MSLKAKIEAVIYASEEPVTLGHLVGLLGVEAQAELEAAITRQGELALDSGFPEDPDGELEPGDPDLRNAETLDRTSSEEATRPLTLEQADEPATTRSGTAPENAPANPDAEVADPVSDGEAGAQDIAMEALATHGPTEPSATDSRFRERKLREYFRSLLDELVAEYRDNDRGLEIREIAGGFRFATKPEYHDAVRGFVRSLKPPLKLSLQALETLAVVAYKQPITAPEISEIRGVDSAGVLGGLMGRKLVATSGRKQVIGRPILYKTTKEFLLRFGLKDVNELPSIEEFERLAAEMDEAAQEEMPMPERPDETRLRSLVGDPARDMEPMRNEHAAQADGIPDEDKDEQSEENADAERLNLAADDPSEFTGDAVVPPADNVEIDGRISGVPPNYDEPGDEAMDSPALDAEIQGAEIQDSEIQDAETQDAEELENAWRNDR